MLTSPQIIMKFLIGCYRENRPLVTVRTQANIYDTTKELPVKWFEIHPLFDGAEFDLAILTLEAYIQR